MSFRWIAASMALGGIVWALAIYGILILLATG